MKVKIKNKIYSANDEPIMIIFDNDNERQVFVNQINNMPYKDGKRKYCIYPDTQPLDDVKKFMGIKNE